MLTHYLNPYITAVRRIDPLLFCKSTKTINKDDIIFVIDMQNDFIPDSPDSKKEGAFAVVEGDSIINPIAKLVKKTKAHIIASRDYHPIDHCSFANFPPHCMWGTHGSKFAKPIERELLAKDSVVVCFKGFHKHADSFGAAPYNLKYAQQRKELCLKDKFKQCKHLNMTGAYLLDATAQKIKISGFPTNFQKKIDNCESMTPTYKPKACMMTSILNYVNHLKSTATTSSKKKSSIYICGLAADYCVLDTAINLSQSKYDSIYIIYDLTRYAWTDEVATINALKMKQQCLPFKDGYYFTPVDKIANKYKKYNIKLISIKNIK